MAGDFAADNQYKTDTRSCVFLLFFNKLVMADDFAADNKDIIEIQEVVFYQK